MDGELNNPEIPQLNITPVKLDIPAGSQTPAVIDKEGNVNSSFRPFSFNIVFRADVDDFGKRAFVVAHGDFATSED